jgi:hypothetical protein
VRHAGGDQRQGPFLVATTFSVPEGRFPFSLRSPWAESPGLPSSGLPSSGLPSPGLPPERRRRVTWLGGFGRGKTRRLGWQDATRLPRWGAACCAPTTKDGLKKPASPDWNKLRKNRKVHGWVLQATQASAGFVAPTSSAQPEMAVPRDFFRNLWKSGASTVCAGLPSAMERARHAVPLRDARLPEIELRRGDDQRGGGVAASAMAYARTVMTAAFSLS